MSEHPVAGQDFAGSNTRMLVEHVQRRLGDEGVDALLAGAEDPRPRTQLFDDGTWSSYAQFRRLLEVAAELLGGMEGFAGLGGDADIGGGTAPEITAILQSLGSPIAVLEATLEGGGPYPAMELILEVVSPTHVRSHRRMRNGFEPFPELCAFLRHTTPILPRLFGYQILEASEEQCLCNGADSCIDIIRWHDGVDIAEQLELTEAKLRLAERRLESFQQTVDEIVSADDLDTVLTTIVHTAARATRANSFVLVVDAFAGEPRLFTEGLTPEEARAQLAAGANIIAVDVASTRNHYGRFIAFDPTRSLAFETASLESWARLAATALDSAFAIEEARRQAQTAGALLELSTSLAELTTAGELAAKVVRAMPDVIDCDCAAVLLVADGMARVAAHHGFAPNVAAALNGFEFPVDENERHDVVLRTLDDASPFARSFMAATNLEAMATAPIAIDDSDIGFLVAAVHERGERLAADEHLAGRFAGLAGQAAVALRNGRLLDHIRHQSLHDPLTDLPNRALILDRTEQMLTRARRGQHATAALFIDLDGFKEINDTLGHGTGDELLGMVADRLRTAVRASDTVGRLGGDEFVVLADGASLNAGVEVVAERLLDVLREPFQLSGRERPMMVGASIGIAVGDRCSAGELLRDADIALYSAKAAGKGCYRVFAPEMQAEVYARAELAEGLLQAVANDEFFLMYQPIFDLSAEVATGVEALLRWQHPTRGVVPPDSFIPLLEETGLIVEVGRWVLQEACCQTAEWHAEGHRIDISVNASVRQLERNDFVDDVRNALATSGLDPSSLIIELTETAIMHDAEATLSVLRQLKALGVRIAIDDFGTGYSSLAYLRQFPVDALKIDRSFIDAIADSPAAAELIHTLVRLGKALNLETLAEGIEDREQLDKLQHEGCDSGQGYMFARPLAATNVSGFLAEHHLEPTSPPSTQEMST